MKRTQHCHVDMVKFQQTCGEEDYMAVNLPTHMVRMVPWKSLVNQGPWHGDLKTSVLRPHFLCSLL